MEECKMFSAVNDCLDAMLKCGRLQNAAIRVGQRNGIILDVFKSSSGQINEKSLFDMASVTKIMVTTPLALIAVDKRLLSIDDKIEKFFDCPEDKKEMTVKNLMTHTMGIGHKAMNKDGVTYDNIQHFILNITSDIKIGSGFLYSCPGFVLLGKILEKVFGQRLDKLFLEYVADPLGMRDSTFLPDRNNKFVNSNLDDKEIGIVNDYNCRFLGGVAGNAGLFSNIEDITKYIKMLLNFGEPLMRKQVFESAIQNYTPNMSESRGLGFVYVDEKFTQTDTLFQTGSIGHCGHTGQSLFVDLNTGLYVIVLTDATISGIKKYGMGEDYEEIMKMRKAIHHAIKSDLERIKAAK